MVDFNFILGMDCLYFSFTLVYCNTRIICLKFWNKSFLNKREVAQSLYCLFMFYLKEEKSDLEGCVAQFEEKGKESTMEVHYLTHLG